MSDEQGTSHGFGLVACVDSKATEGACNGMNGKEMYGETLYVGRAQKQSERQNDLKSKFELLKMKRMLRYEGLYIYVKNLDESFGEEKLRKEFEPYGTITWAKVMVDEIRSKGFGLVCFSSPDEARKAVDEMNGRTVGTKPLYVALAQRKEDRKSNLTSQYIQLKKNTSRKP